MSSSAYFFKTNFWDEKEKKTTKKTTEEEETEEAFEEEEERNNGDNRFYDSRTTRTRETLSSLNSSSSENARDFPRVREILWDAETTTKEKETTAVVWSSDVGPTIFQFLDDVNDDSSLAGRILEKSKSKSVSHHLYARCDFSSSEGNNNTIYSSNSNSNDSFGIVTISSGGVKSNKRGERKRGFSHCSSERRVPLDVSFRRGGGSQEGKKRCERMASRLAWGKSFTSVRESFYATCDAMPLTTKSIVVDAEEKEEEEEEEMDKDKDEDEPLTPLDMWPMRIGAVVERCDGVKTKRNSPPAWKVHLTVALEMPSCAFRFAPIRPLRVSREFSSSSRVISALFDDDHFLNGYNGRSTRESSLSSSSTRRTTTTTRTKMTTGFLTLDRARRLCFLKTNSSRVHNSETPLVGVWIHRLDDDARDSHAFLQSSEVWAACLRYASNSVLRKVSQNGSFLVCVVNGKRKDDDGNYDKRNASAAMPRLECYDCVATQGKEPFVPHQVDVTLNTNADDSNDSADAFVLGAVKEINPASIAFNFDRNNNGIGKENRGKEENDDDDDDDDDDDGNHEIDDIIWYKNFGGTTFPRPSEDTKNMSEAEREVVALEKMLQNRHRRDDEFNKSSPVRGTSVSTRSLSPRSLAADLVKRAERSFANNRRRVKKQTSMQKDARKDGHKPSSVIVDKVLRERLRLVRFVVEDQLVEEEERGRGRGEANSEEEMATGIINTTIFRSNDHHQRENKSGPGDDGDYNDYHNDDSAVDSDGVDVDAHILRKYLGF